MQLLTNFSKKEEWNILACLKCAGIKSWTISPLALDAYGNEIPDYFALYVPDDAPQGTFDRLFACMFVLRNKLYDKYTNMGYPVPPTRKLDLHINMSEEELLELCAESKRKFTEEGGTDC